MTRARSPRPGGRTSRAVDSAWSSPLNPDRLGLGVLVERLDALVPAAESGLLAAAERRRAVTLGEAVDRDGTRAHRARGTQRRVDVAAHSQPGQKRCPDAGFPPPDPRLRRCCQASGWRA